MGWRRKSKADIEAAEAQAALELKAQREKEQREAQDAQRKAEAEAERNEIFRLLRESKGGADPGVLKERRRSLSKETTPLFQGVRFQERKLSPAAIEAEAINGKIQSLEPKKADIAALLAVPPAQAQPKRRRRASTGDINDTLGVLQQDVRRDVRALSTFASPGTPEKISDVTAEVNRRLREDRQKREQADLERLAKKEEEATLETEKKALEATGSKPSAAVAKGKANAMAKMAGGVFLEKKEYDKLQARLRDHDKLQARIKDLEKQVAGLTAAQRDGSNHDGGSFKKVFSPSFKSLSKASPLFRRSASKKDVTAAPVLTGSSIVATALETPTPNRTSSAYWNGTVAEPSTGESEAMRMVRWDARGKAGQGELSMA